jgi:UPF0755 protein
VIRRLAVLAAMVLAPTLAGCGNGEGSGDPIRFTVPRGSGISAVADTLEARGVIRSATVFRAFARARSGSTIHPGIYEMRAGAAFDHILDRLRTGDVVRVRVVVPEGWDLRGIAPRVGAAVGMEPDSVLSRLMDPDAPGRFGVPGPTLEGYLYPATYVLPLGSTLERVVQEMTGRYRAAWTPEMRQRADSLGMDEREVVTLASIVEKEARIWEERPLIAGVYHNRLRRGMRLEADPTVQYAVGEHQRRLLRRHIEETAADPYNTYRHAGLPPGPIASPSAGALQATLHPAEHDFLFFVARTDGSHVFTRSYAEHLREVARYRAALREQRRRDATSGTGP